MNASPSSFATAVCNRGCTVFQGPHAHGTGAGLKGCCWVRVLIAVPLQLTLLDPENACYELNGDYVVAEIPGRIVVCEAQNAELGRKAPDEGEMQMQRVRILSKSQPMWISKRFRTSLPAALSRRFPCAGIVPSRTQAAYGNCKTS